MQGYFKKKTQNSLRPSEHPPVVGGKNKQTQNTQEAWDTPQFLVFRVCYITSIDVDVILGTCSTIEIIICYPK